MFLPLLAVLSQMHYEGDVPVAGGDYADVAFIVPAGTVEILKLLLEKGADLRARNNAGQGALALATASADLAIAFANVVVWFRA